MVSSRATHVEAYLSELPPQRRDVVASVRDLVNEHLPPGYIETMNWGMICWEVPLSRYPATTYNKQPLPYVALAAQMRHYCLYLMGNSTGKNQLRKAYRLAGKKLDMGKTCIRFRSLEDLLVNEIGASVASVSIEDLIAQYESSRRK